jgi:uncharacterized damage-inducible protein DinB
MMTLKDLQELYAYNAWANEQVIQSITGISSEVFEQDLKSSHRSIRGTVAHIASAEWIWLRRWKGSSPRQLLSEGEFTTVGKAVARWKEIEIELADFTRQLKESDLERVFSYTTTEGKEFSNILWQAMQHLVNHSSYHRGQIAALLRQTGQTPQSTDLIKYYRLKAWLI